jgi:LPXTG-motif cell wall-anchored protein
MRAGRGWHTTRQTVLADREERAPVGQHDPSFWALLVGLPLLGLLAGALYIRRRRRGPIENAGTDLWPALPPAVAAEAESGPEEDVPAPTSVRRRPRATAPPAGDQELASAVRSTILRTVAERAPVGWTTLVLCPPPHPELMTWHVHLAPDVALDLRDGRSVPATTPASSYGWSLPGGRTVRVGEGDPTPGPTAETVTVRIHGPYLKVAVHRGAGQAPILSAQVVGLADGSPDLRAAPSDLRGVRAALREAIELAVGSRMLGSPPSLGYGLAAWNGHERVWLTTDG